MNKNIFNTSMNMRIREHIHIEKSRFQQFSEYPCLILKDKRKGRISYKGKQQYCKRFLFHYVREKINDEHLLIQLCPKNLLCIQPFHMEKRIKDYYCTNKETKKKKLREYKKWNQNKKNKVVIKKKEFFDKNNTIHEKNFITEEEEQQLLDKESIILTPPGSPK